MTSLGIITNPTSGRNRQLLDRVRQWTADAGAVSREVADVDSIRAATAAMCAQGVEVLAINGGDGTVQGVLTELARAGGPRPSIALLPGGTTNMSANDINRSRSLDAALDRLRGEIARPDAQRCYVTRPLLEVAAPGIETQYGLFLAAGVVLRGMRHFRENVSSKGLRGELAAGISLVRGLTSVARNRGGWADTPSSTVTPAGGANAWEDQILVIATTLERLFLGMRPWWGGGEGPIHLTGLTRGPRSLLRLTPALLRGRPHRRMSPVNGYRSAPVDGLTLTPGGGFALDGEVFQLPVGAEAAVAATPPVRFVAL